MRRSTDEVDPAALLRALQPKLAAVGITRLADVTGLDRVGLPVVLAVRPLGRSLAVSQGKGLTREEAAVSAILEAMELHHAESHRLPLRYGRDDELAARLRRVDLEQLPYRQGADRERRRPLLWVEGRDLADGGGRWLPYELVHADYSLPQPAASGLFAQSTTGLGAGAARSGAIRHALLEAVERDGLALAQANPEPPTARLLDLDGVEDPDCRVVLAAAAAAGLAVVALDVTSDLAVATISCRLIERQRVAAMAHPAEGSAADPLPERALLKALIEAAQARLAFIAGTRDDLDPLDYVALDAERERDFWLACADADWPRRPVATLPRGPADDDEAIIGWVRARLAGAGLDQVVVVDLELPEIAVPVVRIVVPGLEPPPHPTHAPGRRALARRARP